MEGKSKTDLERVTALLKSQEWIFAKTMPQNPHWYTLRKRWTDDQDFVDVVLFIREHGVIERYPDPLKGRKYTVMVIDGFKCWTMGAPIGATILINRKPAGDSSEPGCNVT